ncbi:MAG: YigZ family protein [Anaerolineales bacterium]|jgi:uncharacterized YigZ family protein|nr:YigZ family protein [Anaerolineales bacterium]
MSSVPYLLPAQEIRRELTVVNSRFIATLAPIANAGEARAFIKRIRAEFADASHNVPAYILGGGNSLSEYCSDDGEPSGTAGRPALTVLRGSGLGDVAVVVTRYFGGTLLGTGGLVKAYTEAAQAVVRDVPRAERVAVQVILLTLPYNLFERVRLFAMRYKGAVLEEDFGAEVTLKLRFPVDSLTEFESGLRELSAGRLTPEIIETSVMLVTVS